MRRSWINWAGLVATVGGVGVANYVFQRYRHRTRHPVIESLILQPELLDETSEGRTRLLRLPGAVNLRDLGGYRTADGQHLKWGMVYRSGSLGKLTDDDLIQIEPLNIRLVCDFRHLSEVEAEPDRLPRGAIYWHSPLDTDDQSRSHRRRRMILWNPQQLGDLLLETYTDVMLDRNAPLFGEMLRRFANPENLPAVFHCTAGKDRTGIAAMLLLLALGVPEETIVADYTLSNRYYNDYLDYTRRLMKRYEWMGIRAEDLYPLLLADARTMQHALDHLYRKYGTIENYLLNQAGLDLETLIRLRATLLE